MIRDDGILMLDIKTIFKPGITKAEIDSLFNKACMNTGEPEFLESSQS